MNPQQQQKYSNWSKEMEELKNKYITIKLLDINIIKKSAHIVLNINLQIYSQLGNKDCLRQSH